MKKLLIVVDYQNDFVNGALGFSGAEKLEGAILDKIAQYHKEGQSVAFTYDTHGKDYLQTQEGRRLPVPHCIRGTQGWELYGGVAWAVRDGDKLFYKSNFGSAELFDYLRYSNFDSIELVGLVSDICVISNAVLAKTALPEAEVTVDAACTASFDPDKNKAALDIMDSLQINVLNR